MSSARPSPLADRHVRLGAKFAEFSGWDMPLEYDGGGVVAEHTATREAVGLFDVSHLGTATVIGDGALDLANAVFTNDLHRIGDGQAQYTVCCDDATGGAIDDLIVYRHDDSNLLLVPNAANAAAVVAQVTAAAPAGVDVRLTHGQNAIIAIQGPASMDVVAALDLPTAIDYMAFATVPGPSGSWTVCRTGYTGERGVEIICPAVDAPALWDRAEQAVRAAGGLPAGLGARDTLRTEMGYPLHGHELSAEISPVMAGLGFAIGWSKSSFSGRAALAGQREDSDVPRLQGIELVERGIPRPGMDVLVGGEVVGVVTSGTFSPTLKKGIALALLPREITEGSDCALDIRGRAVAGRVSRPPFVPSHVR